MLVGRNSFITSIFTTFRRPQYVIVPLAGMKNPIHNLASPWINNTQRLDFPTFYL